MPLKSQYQIDIPATNILDYVFPEGKEASDQPVWIDADDTTNSLSPKQLLYWVERLGAGLEKLGFNYGDAIMMVSSNHIFIPVLYLGIAGAGRVFTGGNPAYGVQELSFQLDNTGAKAIFVQPQYLETVLKVAEKNGFPRERIYLFDDKPCSSGDRGIEDWRTMLAPEAESKEWTWHSMTAQESGSTMAVLNYSSGTTGLPKGVMVSHQNIIANAEQSLFMRRLEQPWSSDKDAPPERWLGFLPLYLAYGQLWSITAAAVSLTPCFVMRSFNWEKWLMHVQTHRITHFQTATPVLVMLAKRPETKHYDLSSLVNILCGGAPLSMELQNEVSDKLNLKIVQTWGMTEVTCSCLHVPGGRDDRSGSVGVVDPNAEIKIVGDDGNEVEVGERGEIHVRGPNITMGYWKNEQATNDTYYGDGWLKTGDVVTRDDSGWHWIVDRKKELIKVKGFQVAPAELEALLLENPSVADSAVCALEMDHEELPLAYVVLKDFAKGKVSESDIRSWVAERVARYKRLDGGVRFIDEVPKSISGKIQRKVLRGWAKKDISSGRPTAKL